MNNTRAIPEARPPLQWHNATMHTGSRSDVMVLDRSIVPHQQRRQRVIVFRAENPERAYRKFANKKSIKLGKNGEKGEIVFCEVLPRCYDLDPQTLAQLGTEVVFEKPIEPRFVAIKILPRLGTYGVDKLVAKGTNDNPYHEIAAMQRFGDYHNIMNVIEALWDASFLYIIMPASDRGDLNVLLRHGALSEIQARTVFQNILNNMEYLQSNGITHRDLKGPNILLDSAGNTRLIDFSMSLRVPHEGDGNLATSHHLIRRTGTCGTFTHMAPEILGNEDFDGYAIDIWALGVILFALLTGKHPWDYASSINPHYSHFINHNGLSDMEVNNLWLQNGTRLMDRDEFRDWAPELLEKIQLFMNLSEEARSLLSGMLQTDRQQRYTLSQVTGSTWMLLG